MIRESRDLSVGSINHGRRNGTWAWGWLGKQNREREGEETREKGEREKKRERGERESRRGRERDEDKDIRHKNKIYFPTKSIF